MVVADSGAGLDTLREGTMQTRICGVFRRAPVVPLACLRIDRRIAR